MTFFARARVNALIENVFRLFYNLGVSALPRVELSLAEQAQLQALRRGDEVAFQQLVAAYHPMMVRLAQMYVDDRHTAEDVAQEAWLGMLRGLERFEGRSSLKTWLLTIVSNLAKTRGKREKRSVPFAFFANYDQDTDEPAVPSERFRAAGDRYAGHWAAKPAPWHFDPEANALNVEVRNFLEMAIERLPAQQRVVLTLRDIQGWTADEVCNALGIAETNQRVLLHRARSKVRRALEEYLQ
jgi:RNA polymerase sigma-70 factor (ECF subfamily)